LAEEIINALTKIQGLQVIARTSAFAFKGKQEDIRKIAEVLGVANILEGSVRKSGNRIRITAQLIEASKGIHLWSERYDRDLTDVFAIQDEIAEAISNALKATLSVAPLLRRRYEPNPSAHEAYLKARYHFGRSKPESVALCRDFFEQAIAIDPQYALAHWGYADHFLVAAVAGYTPAKEAMSMIRKETLRALEIDPLMPEAHAMLGIVAAVYDYDWREAERQFLLAMENDPIPSVVHVQYGLFYLHPLGRTEEAIKQIEQGLKGDPLNLMGQISLVYPLFAGGRLEDAKAAAQRILEFEEQHAGACQFLSLIYAFQEKWEKALHFAEKGYPSLPTLIGLRAGALKLLGQDNQADELIQKLLPGEAYVAPLGLCICYFLCKEIDQAIDYLKKAIEQRIPYLPMFAPLLIRSIPRWPEIAKLMKLPEEAH
jgi:serine/threonine-protein kinase